MFRRPLLPFLLVGVAIGFAAVGPSLALAQDRSTDERLDRIERDLNMLQRQVYRGAPAPMAAGEPGAVNVELRIGRIEEQMRELTGRVEEFTNQVQRLRQRLEQINGDMDARVAQGGQPPGPFAGGSPPSRPALPPRAPTPDTASMGSLGPPAAAPGAGMPPGTAVAPPPGLSPIFGVLSPPGTPGAVPPPAAYAAPPPGSAPEAAREAGGPLPSGAPATQYNYAFGLVKQADYPAAETSLRAFIEQHPNDPLAGSAQYWLGETFYARGKYMEAASAFAEGYKRFPKSPKAAEDLLKLGMSLARANQKQSACVALVQLDHDFPNPSAAVRERAAAEKKRLGC